MSGAERGFLLLCSTLGQGDVKPLTMGQFGELAKRVQAIGLEGDWDSQVSMETLMDLGYGPEMSKYMLLLLSREEILDGYLLEAKRQNIYPITRIHRDYPKKLEEKLSKSRPAVFFASGDSKLLNRPAVAVVGSRNPSPEASQFAFEMGKAIAQSGKTLVTGGAHGVDTAAIQGCQSAGGAAVIFVPDQLEKRLDLAVEQNLVVSADGYDLPFSNIRAHQRNSYIHSLADTTIVVQPRYGAGGTWQGAMENLNHSWSQVFVYQDGTQGAKALMERGAIYMTQWSDIAKNPNPQITLF